jgi:hypothetical protein
VETDRLGSGRLPEHVVLEDPHPWVAHQLRGEAADPRGEHLGRDHGVRAPGVAELPGAVLGVAPLDPVHLVRLDPRFVLAVEQPEVALLQQFQRLVGDQAFLDHEEAIPVELLDLLGRERVDELRHRYERGLDFSGS